MALFVWSLILFMLTSLILVIAFTGFRSQNDPKYNNQDVPRGVILIVAAVVGGAGLLFLFFASVTQVGTKNVAVLTTFGKPTGFLTNGLHLKAPWEKPHELNDAVQTDTYASEAFDGNKQGGAVDTCVHVRVARQAIACVNVSIRWQIRADGVDYLFRNYKDNAAITDNVVLRDLQQAMNAAFISYDPLGIDAQGNNTNTPLSVLSSQVTNQMRSEIGQQIDVQNVLIPLLNFDPATQSRINQLQQQIAATRVAQQAEQTALAQAAANKALAQSVANDPNVLTDKCLNIVKEAVDKGTVNLLPAGFSCFAGNAPPTSVRVN